MKTQKSGPDNRLRHVHVYVCCTKTFTRRTRPVYASRARIRAPSFVHRKLHCEYLIVSQPSESYLLCTSSVVVSATAGHCRRSPDETMAVSWTRSIIVPTEQCFSCFVCLFFFFFKPFDYNPRDNIPATKYCHCASLILPNNVE